MLSKGDLLLLICLIFHSKAKCEEKKRRSGDSLLLVVCQLQLTEMGWGLDVGVLYCTLPDYSLSVMFIFSFLILFLFPTKSVMV